MKKILISLLLSAAVFRVDAQIVQSSVTSVVEEKVPLNMKYRGFAEVGLGLDLSWMQIAYEITTTHGVLLTSGTFVGAGIGITGFKKQVGLPLYFDARQFLGHRRDRGLFVGMRIGYNCSLKKQYYEYLWKYPDKDCYTYKTKGLLVSPCIGITMKRFDVSLSYLLSKEETNYNGHFNSSYKNSILLRAGIYF